MPKRYPATKKTQASKPVRKKATLVKNSKKRKGRT